MKYFLIIAIILLKIVYLKCDHCSDKCENKTQLVLYTPNCFCHDCDLYDDCCEDVMKSAVKSTKASKTQCNIRISEYEYVYSIVECGKAWTRNDINRYKCEKQLFNNAGEKKKVILNYLPVYSTRTNSTYRNMYCAKCNFEEINELTFFQLKPSASFMSSHNHEVDDQRLLNIILDEFIANETSHLYFGLNSPQAALRKCFNSIDTCPEKSSPELKELCSNHTAYRYNSAKDLFYRNKYCGLCNGESVEDLECGRMKRIMLRLQRLFDISDMFDKNITCLNDDTLGVENEIKKYLTITGHTVSIVSLVLLLIVYSASKKLRNFPGQLLISLSLALMLSQIIFTFSTYLAVPLVPPEDCETKNNIFNINVMLTPCYIFAILTHYFYLSFFAWSNVMAFDLFYVFSSLSSKSSRTASISEDDQEMKRLKFLKYSAYAWLSPLVICLSAIIKQFFTNNLSYGFRACFLAEKIDLLIFFVVPVAMVLVSNLYFLVNSIISIRNVDKATKKVLKKEPSESSDAISSARLKKTKSPTAKANNQEKNRLVLFLKLFFLTGMTWILGLVCTLVSRDSFLWYIYIVLNSLQGLFIFVSFAFSPQSRRHFKSSKFFTNLSSVIAKKDRSDAGTSSSFLESQKR